MLHAVSTSDWHLTGGLARLFPMNALEKQMREIEKPFKYAVENNIPHLFMPGDISDKARLDEASFIALITLLLKYDEYLSFYYSLGNHDFAHVGKTSMDVLKVFIENSVFKNVHLFESPTIKRIDGVNVCFMPFPHTEVPESKNGNGRLILAHIEEPGAIGDNGVPLKSHGLKLQGRNKDDVVVSGHLHTYQYLKERRTLFNGSLYQKNFGESLPKGFVELKVREKGGIVQMKHEFIDSRPEFSLVNMTIENSDDWDKLEKGDHLLYKIQLADGVVAPKHITREFPNIIHLNGVTYRGRSNLEVGEKTSAKDIPKITPLTGLVEYLHGFDLKKAQIKRAVEMVKEAIRELQNNG